jgi:hypothetical protein
MGIQRTAYPQQAYLLVFGDRFPILISLIHYLKSPGGLCGSNPGFFFRDYAVVPSIDDTSTMWRRFN